MAPADDNASPVVAPVVVAPAAVVAPAVVETPVVAPVVTPPAAVVAPAAVVTPPADGHAATPPATPDTPVVAGDWPEDWREKYAGTDEKVLNQLKRYSSPKAALDSLFEARKKISTGAAAKPAALADDATPEQIKAYREELGIPDAPEGYDTVIADGHVWGDDAKPVVDSFTKFAHTKNTPPGVVKDMLTWWANERQGQADAYAKLDADYRKANLDKLSAEWGANLSRESRIATEFWQSQMPPEVYARLQTARDDKGMLLFNDAEFIRAANRMQREVNPSATVIPGSGINSEQAIGTELESIVKMMGDQNSPYFKGEKVTIDGRSDTKMAHRFIELTRAQERSAGRR